MSQLTLTCASKEMHINLLQEVYYKRVDLRQKANEEGDGETIGESCGEMTGRDISNANTGDTEVTIEQA